MGRGCVYVMTNESMPGLVKIGGTSRDAEDRAAEIFQTGVPTPFDVSAIFDSPDWESLEAAAHKAFEEQRVSKGREFFRVHPCDAEGVIHDLHDEQIEYWLNEFKPDHVAVPVDFSVCPSIVLDLVRGTDINMVEFFSAIRFLAPADIQSAVQEHRQWAAERRAESKPDGGDE